MSDKDRLGLRQEKKRKTKKPTTTKETKNRPINKQK